MKCNNCGMELNQNDMFCSKCGTQVQKVDNNINNGVKNENMYNYERNVNQVQQTINNNQQQYQPKKKPDNVSTVCIIIIIVVILLFFIVLGAYIMSVAKKALNVISTETTNTLTQTDDYSETLTSVSNNKESTYKVSFSGFNLYIPDNLIYEVKYINNRNYLIIADAEQTWVAQLFTEECSFEDVKHNKNQLSNYFTNVYKESNGRFSNAKLETINNVEYITLEGTVSGTNILVGGAELNSMNVLDFLIQNEDNDYDRNPLSEISKIISTAEYTNNSSFLKSNENIKITGINKEFIEMSQSIEE